jgi:hypothetical protein
VTEASIRVATIGDLPELYEVALKTGNSGTDASGMYVNDVMLGEVFVGPYVTLAPETSFALTQGVNVVGYGLCVVDTVEFQSKSEELWWPKLQQKYQDHKSAADSDWLLKEIFSPSPSPVSILESFPSHGHIDLLPSIQGLGWGKKMMQKMELVLSHYGSPGFHLRVSANNERALKFYGSIGYLELLRRDDEVVVGKVLK